MTIVRAVEQVVATSAAHASEEGTLTQRVCTHLGALEALVEALRQELSVEAQLTLLRVLVDMHCDPFERDINDAFLESLGPV